MKRLVHNDPASYNEKDRGVASDQWHFTVVHNSYALTLSVFGTDIAPEVPAWHPARQPQASSLFKRPRGASLTNCRPATSEDDPHQVKKDCPYLGVDCAGDASYSQADPLWVRAGNGDPKTEQPDSFWEALERVARYWCDCCDDEGDGLEELLARLPLEPISDSEKLFGELLVQRLSPEDLN